MALHRDIFWVGRQWAVTGLGVQACDQRQKSQFDIESCRLWDDDLLQALRAHAWLNVEDFEKALAVARARFPVPAPQPSPPDPVVLPVAESPGIEAKIEKPDAAKPAPVIPVATVDAPEPTLRPQRIFVVASERPAPRFEMRFAGSAKFTRPWRVQKR